MTAPQQQPRTYGQWRRGLRAGLFGLGPVGTGVAFGFTILAIAMSAVSRVAAVWIAVAGVITLGPLMVRVNGRTGLQVLSARLAWWWGTSRRRHMYVAGAASAVTDTQQLPGLLARSVIYDVPTGRGNSVGIVVIPQTRHYSFTLRCDTEGIDLVDQDVIDSRVGRWALWLASLGREPMLVQAQVTVDTAPDPGTRLVDELAATTTASAPPLATQVLDEVTRRYPLGAARVQTWVTCTFSAPPGRVAHEDVCRDVAAKLPHLLAGLTGVVASVNVLTAAGLALVVRSAYDPVEAADLDRDQPHIGWDAAGPVAARESWDHYRHDSGVSRSWGMLTAPMGTVYSTMYSRLTDPAPTLLRKRVAIIYRPYGPAEAARLVERDKRDAYFTASKRAASTARDSADVAAAEQSAREEARGAGMTRFTILVTATVTDETRLAEAESIIKAQAGEARIALRRMSGSQAATFAACLPVGIVLHKHATIPF